MAGEHRKFAQSKSRLSASEARGTVIDTMRGLRDATDSPGVKMVVEEPTIVDPVDYEAELITKKKVLENEEYKDLLLFPHNDISVSTYIHTTGKEWVWQLNITKVLHSKATEWLTYFIKLSNLIRASYVHAILCHVIS